MKAPEKLYVNAEDRLSDSILYGFTEKRKNNDIAYIRNDAFIEKACEWLEKNFNMPNDFEYHFRKAMKGE